MNSMQPDRKWFSGANEPKFFSQGILQMAGGLMQLVAYGAQDVYLTGQPKVTFFQAVYNIMLFVVGANY